MAFDYQSEMDKGFNQFFGDSHQQQDDYSQTVAPDDLLYDRRFRQDVAQYYTAQGKRFDDEDDMVRSFLSDFRWDIANTVSAATELGRTKNASQETLDAMNRLHNTWERLPNFAGLEGDWNIARAVADYGAAGILDPINLVGGFIGKAGGQVVAKGASQGAKHLVRQSAGRGAIQGAKVEAGVGAAAMGAIEHQRQGTQIELGRQESRDFGRIGSETLLGGVMGAAGGALFGGAGGGMGASKEILEHQARQMADLGIADQAAPVPGFGASARQGISGAGRRELDDTFNRQAGLIEDARVQAEADQLGEITRLGGAGAGRQGGGNLGEGDPGAGLGDLPPGMGPTGGNPLDDMMAGPNQAGIRRRSAEDLAQDIQDERAALRGEQEDGLPPEFTAEREASIQRNEALLDAYKRKALYEQRITADSDPDNLWHEAAADIDVARTRAAELESIISQAEADPNFDIAARLAELRQQEIEANAQQQPNAGTQQTDQQSTAGQAGQSPQGEAAGGTPQGERAPGAETGQPAGQGQQQVRVTTDQGQGRPEFGDQALRSERLMRLNKASKDRITDTISRQELGRLAESDPEFADDLLRQADDDTWAIDPDSTPDDIRAMYARFRAEQDGKVAAASNKPDADLAREAAAEADQSVPPIETRLPIDDADWPEVTFSKPKGGGPNLTEQLFNDAKAAGLITPDDIPAIKGKNHIDRAKLKQLIKSREAEDKAKTNARTQEVEAEAGKRKREKAKAKESNQAKAKLSEQLRVIIEEDSSFKKETATNVADAEQARLEGLRTNETLAGITEGLDDTQKAVMDHAIHRAIKELVEGTAPDMFVEGLSDILAGINKMTRNLLNADENSAIDALAKTYIAGSDSPAAFDEFKAIMRVLESRKGKLPKPKAKPAKAPISEITGEPVFRGPEIEGVLPDGSFDGIATARAYADNRHQTYTEVRGDGKPVEKRVQVMEPVRFKATKPYAVRVGFGEDARWVNVIERGQHGWYDPLTKRAYSSYREMRVARGDAVPEGATGKAAPTESFTDSARKAMDDVIRLVEGANSKPRRGGTKQPPAKTKTESAQQVTPQKPLEDRRAEALQQWMSQPVPEGYIPALVEVGKNGQPLNKNSMRVLRRNQQEAGKSFDGLLVNGDPDRWMPGFVPERYLENPDRIAARAEFTPLGSTPDKPAQFVVAEDLALFELNADQLKRAKDAGLDLGSKKTADSLHMALLNLDTASGWSLTASGAERTINKLTTGYQILREIAPDGVLYPQATRESAIKDLRQRLAGRPKEVIEEGVRFLESLSSRGAPILTDDEIGKRALGNTRTSKTASTIQIGDQALDPMGMGDVNTLHTLYHEVAHWAYINILTPQDRLDFWNYIKRDLYDDKGSFNKKKLLSMLPPHAEGGKGGFKSNATADPNELFANKFVDWLTQKPEFSAMQNPDFWSRMTRMIKAVFEWFGLEKPIDPDLERLFSKIIPDEAERVRHAANGTFSPDDLSDLGKTIYARAQELDSLEREIKTAILNDSPSGTVESAKAILSHVYARAPRIVNKEGAAITPKRLMFSPLKSDAASKPLIEFRDRLSQVFKDVADIDVVNKLPPSSQAYNDPISNKVANLKDVLNKQASAEASMEVLSELPVNIKTKVLTYLRKQDDALFDEIADDAELYFRSVFGDEAAEPVGGATFIYDNQVDGSAAGRIENSEALAQALKTFFENELKASDTSASLPIFDEIRRFYLGAIEYNDGLAAAKMPEVPRSIRRAQPLTREERSEMMRRVPMTKARRESIDKTRARVVEQAARETADPNTRKRQGTATKPDAKWQRLPMDQLIEEYRNLKNVSDADRYAIARAITAKRNSKINLGAMTEKEKALVGEMKAERNIQQQLMDALDGGDLERARALIHLGQTRAEAKASKTIDSGFIVDIIGDELRHRSAPETENGIPEHAPLAIKDVLRGIRSRRHPEIERTSRTLAYRLLTLNQDPEAPHLVWTDDVYRLVGDDVIEDGGVLRDYRDPAFTKLKTSVRSIAVRLGRGGAEADEAMEDLGQMIVNSRALDDDDGLLMDRLFDAWESMEIKPTEAALQDLGLDSAAGMTPEKLVARLWAKTAMSKPKTDFRDASSIIIGPENASKLINEFGFGPLFADKSLQDISDMLTNFDVTGWDAIGSKTAFDKHNAIRRELAEIIDKLAPEGFKRPVREPDALITSIRQTLIENTDNAPLADAVEGLLRVAAGDGKLPVITEMRKGGSGFGAFNLDPTDNAIEISPTQITEGLAGLGRGQDSGVEQGYVIVHELFHWAYENVLSSKERDQFWSWMGKTLYKDGTLDQAAFERYVEPTGSLMWADAGVAKTAGVEASNAARNPAELFANLGLSRAMSMSRGEKPSLADERLWNTVSRYVMHLYNWLTNKHTVPKDLEPVFERIMPRDGAKRTVNAAEASDRYGLSLKAVLNEDDYGPLAEPGRALINKINQSAAYILNGQVGSDQVKNDYLKLFIYGDMFSDERALALRNNGTLIPGMEGAFEASFYKGLDRKTEAAIKGWVGRGIGAAQDGSPIIYYTRGDGLISTSPNGIVDNKLVRREGLSPDHLEALDKTDQMLEGANDLYALASKVRSHKHPDLDEIERITAEADDLKHSALMIREQVAEANNLDVQPVLVKAASPIDFSDSGIFQISQRGGTVEALSRALTKRQAGMADREMITLLQDEIAQSASFTNLDGNPTITGADLETALARIAGDGDVERGKPIIEEIVGDLGYDAINQGQAFKLIRHKDRYGHRVEPSDLTRSAANTFFEAEPIEPTTRNPSAHRTSGNVLNSVVDTLRDQDAEQQLKTALHHSLKEASDDTDVVSSFLTAAEGGVPSEAQFTKVAKASVATLSVGSNAKRMRQYSMGWLGDVFETYMPAMQRQFMTYWTPVSDALEALEPDAGRIQRAFRKWTDGIAEPLKLRKQPEAHRKILRALRYNPATPEGQRHLKALAPPEFKAYKQIRASLDRGFKDLEDAGIIVGKIENYFPQIYDLDAIQRSPEQFKTAIRRYLLNEWEREGIAIDDPDFQASQRAQYILSVIVNDEGMVIPGQIPTTNYASAQHLDHQRMIRLQNDPEAMALMDEGGFLSNDLEASLSKYYDQASRRITEAKSLGYRGFGLADYLKVAYEGRHGVKELLSTDKTFTLTHAKYGTEGYIERAKDGLDIPMPLSSEGAAHMADDVIDELYTRMATGSTNGTMNREAGREFLLGLNDRSTWPPFSRINYERRIDTIVNAIADTDGGNITPDPEAFRDAQSTLLAIQGRFSSGDKEIVKSASRSLRAFNSITLLDMAMLSSLSDVVLPMIRSGDVKASVKAISKYASDPDYRRMIRNTGVAIESVLHSRMQGLYAGDIKGWTGRAQTAFFQANMLTPWTDMMRKIAGATGLEAFDSQVRKASRAYKMHAPDTQQPREWKRAKRILNAYGLGEYAYPAKFSKTLSAEEPVVAEAMIRFANDTVFSPDPVDVPLWAQTPIGQIVWQLKSFPVMMARAAWGTDQKGGVITNFYRYGRGRVGDAVPMLKRFSKAGDDAYSAKDALPFMALMTAGPLAGASVMATKDVLQSRNQDSPGAVRERNISKTVVGEMAGMDERSGHDFAGWYIEGMMMSGGLGFLAEIFQDAAANADNGWYGVNRMTSSILGPTAGLGVDAFRAFQGVSEGVKKQLGASDSEGLSKERTAARSLAGRIPFVGGQYGLREGLVDALAGEEFERKGSARSGGGGSGFNRAFDDMLNSYYR